MCRRCHLPALEGTSGDRRHRVLGRLPADLGYEPIAESGALLARTPDEVGGRRINWSEVEATIGGTTVCTPY